MEKENALHYLTKCPAVCMRDNPRHGMRDNPLHCVPMCHALCPPRSERVDDVAMAQSCQPPLTFKVPTLANELSTLSFKIPTIANEKTTVSNQLLTLTIWKANCLQMEDAHAADLNRVLDSLKTSLLSSPLQPFAHIYYHFAIKRATR